MESSARILIVGAGVVGCSTAYHLARAGITDVLVVDQGPLFGTGGSSSHAPGLVFQTNASQLLTQLATYTVERFSAAELDGRPCFHQVGGIEVATTRQRWDDLRRKRGLADDLPNAPGVYLFRGPNDEVLYVGTATDLRRRVRQYFTAGERRSRVREMVALAHRVDHVRCAHPLEAEVRELRLLGAHQ